MPQLEQLHRCCAAASAQSHMKASASAAPPSPEAEVPLPLAPPVPRAVLFNSVVGTAYQVLTSAFASAPLTSVNIFTVQRLPLVNSHLFSFHMVATARCRLPFCVSDRGVTWNDIVTTLLLPHAAPVPTSLQWNVQVLGQDAVTGVWGPITPSLSSRLETRYFLCTDVEVLFRHYRTSTLYMQAVPLTGETAGPDWLTPLQRSTSPGATPPPAPVKPPRHAAALQTTTTPPPSGGLPPRRLAADSDSAVRPAMWSLAAFVQQQRRWGCRCSVLRDRVAGLAPREVLRLVWAELRLCCTASAVGRAVAADTADAGAATWALSLLEHECVVLADQVHSICAAPPAGQSLPLRLCWKRLRQAAQVACKVVQVVDSVLSAAGAAEHAGVVAADFPRDWLALLLASLRLRGLRHLALAHASGATARADKPPLLHGAAPVWAMEVLVDEAVQTAGWVVESLCSLCERSTVLGLPHAALLEPLLGCTLSLAELAAYLSTNTSHRCALMKAAVTVCRLRVCLLRGDDGGGDGGDARWLPQCVYDVVARMQSKLDRVPLTSDAFADYASLLRLMRDSAACVAAHQQAGTHKRGSTAAATGLLPLGYIIAPTPTLAAVDAAYIRGNTVVRELRSAAAAAWHADAEAQEDGDTGDEEDAEEGGATEPPDDTDSSNAPEPSDGTAEGVEADRPRATDRKGASSTDTPHGSLRERSISTPR